jgi:hypothetical protein
LVIPKPQIIETWDFDVAGAYPLVPMYCAGDPACMVTELNQEHLAARPIVRIDFGKDTNWTTTTEAIMLRGAAGLSLAATLESLGYSTELRIVGGTTSNGQTLKYSIIFKPAGEILDLDRAAFALAHPSTLRRFTFALYEQHAELWRNFHSGYGRPTFSPVDPTSGRPGGAIFIPAPSGRETTETARQSVELAAKQAGFDQALDLALAHAA